MTQAPTIALNNGKTIPIFGLGTWRSKREQVTEAVKTAIDVGYRHIDCAHIYCNEKYIGKGIQEKISKGVVKREDLFITSKLWNTFHRPDLVEQNIKISLKNLRLEYLDLYLMHWPFAFKEGEDLLPVDRKGNLIYSEVDYVDTWKAMETLNIKGLAKSIGVCNFNKTQLERLLQNCTITPAVNQIECHPYLTQTKLSEFCKSKNIAITAYCPLGSPNNSWAQSNASKILADPKINIIAEKYQKTSAQILLRYQVQRGHVTIPKSVNKWRIEKNFDVWNFVLSREDMDEINSLDCNCRSFFYNEALGHKYHPFFGEDEY